MPSVLRIKQQKHGIIRRYAVPDDLRALAESLATLLPLGLLWWAAVLSVGISPWLTATVIVLISLLTIRVLVLMHECGHASLFRTRRLNHAFGFLFGVIAGMPQYVWSQHHDFHHANNGNWEKFRGPLTTPSVAEYAAMSIAQQRTYRYTRSLALAPLGGFLYLILMPRFNWIMGSIGLLMHIIREKLADPSLSVRACARAYRTRYWNSPKEFRHMSWNNVVLLTLWLLMSIAVGPGLFFLVYLTTLSVAGGVGIALFTVQHNFEHSYATDSARWDYDRGAVKGTSFLLLPGWLNWVTANIGYHHIHHLSSRIPSYRLAACHNDNSDLFADIRRVPLSHLPSALKCLLWDTEAQRIISFAEYRRLYTKTA